MTTQEHDKRVSDLESKVAQLQEQLRQLQKRFTCQPVPDDCTEYKGAVFQKKLGGGYREAIFCPACGSPMGKIADRSHFKCPICSHEATFPGKTLADILDELPK